MEAFEVTVRGERWRIAERGPADATPAWDLTRLSGPDIIAYGFAGFVPARSRDGR